MAKATVVATNLFYDTLDEIRSLHTLDQIARNLELLSSFPDLGQLATSPSLTSRFGKRIRTLVCGSYILVYRHESDDVEVLALFPAKLVR